MYGKDQAEQRVIAASAALPRIARIGAVSYTHLDVYKRQVLTRLEPQGGIALEDLFLSLTATDQPSAGTPS